MRYTYQERHQNVISPALTYASLSLEDEYEIELVHCNTTAYDHSEASPYSALIVQSFVILITQSIALGAELEDGD